MGELKGSRETCDPNRIAREINTKGFSVVPDYIAPHQLKRAQNFVIDTLTESSGASIIVRGRRASSDTFICDLPQDPCFLNFCRDIYEAGTGAKAPDKGCYQVLRCLPGTSGDNVMNFHFDSYVLAALIPIIVPVEGMRGDLLLLPNVRKIRKTYALSLLDKTVLATPFVQGWLRRMYDTGDPRLVRIPLIPGSLYFFWGYMSPHTNEEWNSDSIRSTVLFHFVDPHAESRLNRLLPTSRLKHLVPTMCPRTNLPRPRRTET